MTLQLNAKNRPPPVRLAPPSGLLIPLQSLRCSVSQSNHAACPQTKFCRPQTALPQSKTAVVQQKTRQPRALSPHLHPVLPEGGRGEGIGEDPLVLTPAPALLPRRTHRPPALPLPLQKDENTATGVQRAARVHRHPALHPFPAPHVGATGGPTLDRGVAGQDPDPGPGLGHHPDPDHHLRVFTVASGETFTAAESPGSSGESTRSGYRSLKP